MSTKYTFYITDTEGKRTEWEGLSFKRARDMHAYTAASRPSNITGHGWYEESCPLEFTTPSTTEIQNLTNVSEGAEV
jgi:hypothetical protein